MSTELETRVKEIIHAHIKEIWLNQIQKDYSENKLLKEDSLKNAFYHHLRNELGDTFLDEHNLYIYTELNDGPLKGTGKRADVAIIRIDEAFFAPEDGKYRYLGDYIQDVVAIFELKYKASYSAIQDILSDVHKLQSYIEDDQIESKYYLMAICEISGANEPYIQDSDIWAKGNVTELVASYKAELDETIFSVFEH